MEENPQAGLDPSGHPVILEQQQTVPGSIRDGWEFFTNSLQFLFQKPTFLIPLFIAWVLVAAIVLYVRYYFTFPHNGLVFLDCFIILFLIAYVICIANIMLLELMRQVEEGEQTSFFKAFFETFSLDAIKVIPLAVFLAFVWFVVLIIKALTSRKRSSSDSHEPSLADAGRTLGGMNGNPLTWLGLGLSMFEKLIRMVVFLALPAIAWEDKGSFAAFGEAVSIIKKHPIQFLTSYAVTGVVGIIMAIPLMIIGALDDSHVHISDTVWLLVIIYEGFSWTLGIYLEQMSVALLYLWHLKWVKNGSVGDISDLLKPTLLTDFHSVTKQQTTTQTS